MAVLVVCGVDEHGQIDILAAEPMLEEPEDTYLLLFRDSYLQVAERYRSVHMEEWHRSM